MRGKNEEMMIVLFRLSGDSDKGRRFTVRRVAILRQCLPSRGFTFFITTTPCTSSILLLASAGPSSLVF